MLQYHALATPTRVIDFLSLLELLSPAEQFLICSLQRSTRELRSKVRQLQNEDSDNIDEIAVIRAEIHFMTTVQTDFLTEVITASREARIQREQQALSSILRTITNTERSAPTRNVGHHQNEDLPAQQTGGIHQR
jgi:type IV secretory pathway VirB10-like protein